MNTLIVYDSAYGNTEKIAQAIGSGLAAQDEAAPVRHVGDVTLEDLTNIALLVAGSPTQSMNFTESMGDFLKRIPTNGLADVKVAAFDTRMSNEDMRASVQSRITRLIVRVFLHRFAAGPLVAALEKKGGKRVIQPEGFFVADTEGPLKAGELERAADWGRQIREKLSASD